MTLLVIVRTQQVAGDVLHFFSEQRRAVHFDQTQYPMGGMQLVGALFEQRPLIRALGIALEGGPGVVQGRRQLFGDDVQSLRTDVGHAGIVFKRQAPKPLALRIFPELPALLLLAVSLPAGAVSAGATVPGIGVFALSGDAFAVVFDRHDGATDSLHLAVSGAGSDLTDLALPGPVFHVANADGVLILMVPGKPGHRKLKVEVGYGLEGILPDGKVGALMDQYAGPSMKRRR